MTMKKLILLLGIVILFAGCKTTSEPVDKQKDETAKKNMEIVKEYFSAFENEDTVTIKELLTDDFIEAGPGIDEEYDLEETIEGFKHSIEMFDSLKVDFVAITTEHNAEGELAGDWVMSWVTIQAYHVEAEKSIKVNYHSVYKIEEGKIAMVVNYWDRLDFYKQLGAKLVWDDDDDDDEGEEDEGEEDDD